MRVAELIEILEDMDPEAEVLIGSQENWPYAELRNIQSWGVFERAHRFRTC